MSSTVKLYGFTGSNSVYTGRLMLEHKGIEHTFVKLPPAAHAIILLLRGFPTTGAPALKIDGRKVQGTRWIARALDELHPGRRCSRPTPLRVAPCRTPSAGARSCRTPCGGSSTAPRGATRRPS